VRRARYAAGLTQREVARLAGVSQALISRLELRGGVNVPLGTWVRVAEVVGLDWHVTFPTDHQRLSHDIQRRCHGLVATLAGEGGWSAWTTIADDPGRTETVLEREERHEVAIIRVWDVLGNVPAEIGLLEERLDQERDDRGVGWRVGGAVVVVATGSNRRRLIESRSAVGVAFSSRAAEWLAALGKVRVPLPTRPGLIWTDEKLERLRPLLWHLDYRRQAGAGG
jgi:transcriptional regulator with XRE-family HTH domain